MEKRISSAVAFPPAVIIYIIFAAWLFYPHLQKLSAIQRLFPLEAIVAAAGVFILCRRWVLSFFASLIGGAIFGFGIFACSFFCYHPFAGLVYAVLPWTFVPAVFFYQWTKLDSRNTAILSGLLSLLPFLFILLAYEFSAGMYLYPIPADTRLSIQSLLGIVNPSGAKPDIFALGFYHVSVAGLIMGCVLLVRTRRIWTIVLIAAAIFAAFYRPIMHVPPVMWASVPVLFCSIIIASGLETLILAGAADSKLLLASAVILFLFGLFNVFVPGQSGLSPQFIGMYGLGVLVVMLIFFIARANRPWHGVRMFVLYSAALMDILISTKYIIDIIF
ncbi:MAG: hypothetical protein WC496_06155 [Phycisphaerae bacterium]|jgi:hypothetical protein